MCRRFATGGTFPTQIAILPPRHSQPLARRSPLAPDVRTCCPNRRDVVVGRVAPRAPFRLAEVRENLYLAPSAARNTAEPHSQRAAGTRASARINVPRQKTLKFSHISPAREH